MTLDQFLRASEEEQLQVLWEARFVSERSVQEFVYTRYQVFDFYIEVCVKDHAVVAFDYFSGERSAVQAGAGSPFYG